MLLAGFRPVISVEGVLIIQVAAATRGTLGGSPSGKSDLEGLMTENRRHNRDSHRRCAIRLKAAA